MPISQDPAPDPTGRFSCQATELVKAGHPARIARHQQYAVLLFKNLLNGSVPRSTIGESLIWLKGNCVLLVLKWWRSLSGGSRR